MTKNRSVIIAYIFTTIFVGLILSYAFMLKRTHHRKQEVSTFISANFQQKDLNNLKSIFEDSTAIYRQIVEETTKACPDSSIYKFFFKDKQQQTEGLGHFFKFIFKSFDILYVSSVFLSQEDNYITLKATFSCSRKFKLTILFFKNNGKLKISKIYGLNELSTFLCPILKK